MADDGKRAFRQFGTLATIDGFDVVCETTGRTVAHRTSKASANGVAHKLNCAASRGSRELSRAFGRVYDRPEDSYH